MGKPTGFLEYNRETAKVLPPKVRIANFKEFRTPLNKEKHGMRRPLLPGRHDDRRHGFRMSASQPGARDK